MEVCTEAELIAIKDPATVCDGSFEIGEGREAQIIGYMRHGAPPRLMAPELTWQPNSRESHATPSAGNRMILKLIGLDGLLSSEEEADELKSSGVSLEVSEDAATGEGMLPHEAGTAAKPKPGKGKAKGPQGGADEIKRQIDKAASINAVTDLMLLPETQKSLNELPVAVRDEIRDYAKARLVALGWPSKQAA